MMRSLREGSANATLKLINDIQRSESASETVSKRTISLMPGLSKMNWQRKRGNALSKKDKPRRSVCARKRSKSE